MNLVHVVVEKNINTVVVNKDALRGVFLGGETSGLRNAKGN